MKKRRVTYTEKSPIPVLQYVWFQVTDIEKCPKTISEYLHQFISCTSAVTFTAERELNQIRINPLKEGVGEILKKVEEQLSFIVEMRVVVADNIKHYHLDERLSEKFSTVSFRYETAWQISLEGLEIYNYKGFEVDVHAICDSYEEIDTTSFWKGNGFHFSEILNEVQFNTN